MTHDLLDTKREDVIIRTHSEIIQPSFTDLDASHQVTGTGLSLLWVHYAERNNLIRNGSIGFNIALTLRNQSDFSNILIILGTYSAIDEYLIKSPERILVVVANHLFDKAKKYVAESGLKGADGKLFEVPECKYTDDKLKKQLTWTF